MDRPDPKRIEQFYQLSYYTLEHPDSVYFIHQHAVDAFTAQTADKNTKPISITFALAGLFLLVEKNYSGRQVQQVHMKMARHKKVWPLLKLPKKKGAITVEDVLSAQPGSDRDSLIKEWCKSVWLAYSENHQQITTFTREYLTDRGSDHA